MQYLETVQFDSRSAPNIAAFSIRQMGWFVLFLALATGWLALILSGLMAGKRARWAGILLGLLLAADLGRASLPWMRYWDYHEKYATNPILDLLRKKPFEHRVAILPFGAPPQAGLLHQLYAIEWAPHLFPYYNIQSFAGLQLQRMPADLEAYERALGADGTTNPQHRLARRWELANTRFLLGAAQSLDALNQSLDPVQRRFHIVAAFDIVPKPGIADPKRLEDLTAVLNPNGQYALFEFAGALPRAKLYSHWQVSTNEQATLEQLSSPAFAPEGTVLVDRRLAVDPVPDSTGTDPGADSSGSVEWVSYAPKEIVLQTKAEGATVLLLNDRFDPQWSVKVDGQPATLLRCNHIMRGVQLAPGAHTVQFSFRIPIGWPLARLELEPDAQALSFVFHIPTGLPSYVTLTAYAIGLVLAVAVVLSSRAGRPKPGTARKNSAQ